MAGQNVRFTDPVVGEKTIRSLGVGPVLAHQRNAFAHGALDLRYQFAEPLVQALVEGCSQRARDQTMRQLLRPLAPPLRIGARQGITVDSFDAMVCALPQSTRLNVGNRKRRRRDTAEIACKELIFGEPLHGYSEVPIIAAPVSDLSFTGDDRPSGERVDLNEAGSLWRRYNRVLSRRSKHGFKVRCRNFSLLIRISSRRA